MAEYYEPMLYICSDEMPFSIRIETNMTDEIDGEALNYAVNSAIKRYPYFSVRVQKKDGELTVCENREPVVVYEGRDIRPLGSAALNRHLTAVSYCGKTINFHMSHVLCDGCGFFPYLKSVLYLYLCRRYNEKIDSAGVRMTDEPFFDDELGNPFPEEMMKKAEPLGKIGDGDYFRLRDSQYVTDNTDTVYRITVSEDEIMRFNHDNDGSPCAVISSMMSKAIRRVHPEEKKDVISAVSFNLRPGLGNAHSYRMLCSAIKLRYPVSLKDAEVSKICTCSRGMVTVQSQSENVLYNAQKKKESVEAILSEKDLETKRRLMSALALKDATDNTFSVSYVGKMGFGEMEKYIDSMYNITDGSTYKTLFIEVSAINGKFDIAFLQGFSSDVYFRAFLDQLRENGLGYEEQYTSRLMTARIVLP